MAKPSPSTKSDLGERPEKYLSRLGIASRREVARWIEAGRLAANGCALRGGERVTPADRLTLDGRRLEVPVRQARRRVVLYHKPVGEVVSRRDPQGRPTVFRALPNVSGGRWVSVGRLDVATSGLLLFTTDGNLAARLMHPRHQVERRYLVRVRGNVSLPALQQLTEGVVLDDGPARLLSCVPVGRASGSNRWFRISLAEGRNREVRRLFAAVGLEVGRLCRIGYGPLDLPRDLPPGGWLELDAHAVAELEDTPA